ncbi:hypothetical protein D9M72_547350 [compost metagenome]
MLKSRRHHARCGVGAHDRSTRGVRCLVLARIEVALPRLRCTDRGGTHGARDPGGLVRDVLAHPVIVLVKVEGHAQQRQAVGVAVRRIEVEVVLAVRVVAAVHRDVEGVRIPVGVGLLPRRSPVGRSGRVEPGIDGTAVRHVRVDVAAAEEAEPCVIEVVAVELVHHHLRGARRHERIDEPVLEEHRYR